MIDETISIAPRSLHIPHPTLTFLAFKPCIPITEGWDLSMDHINLIINLIVLVPIIYKLNANSEDTDQTMC